LLLLLGNPGLWVRSTPGYIAHDDSIGNRFELWRGAVKLITSSPLSGWGYYNTGSSHMNWFQGINDHTYYNGLVNSYLQIGAAFGLPVLCGLLFLLFFALLRLSHFRILDQVSYDKPMRFIRLLSFQWLIIWMLMSCFSSMLSSPMLMIPPLVAVVVALFPHPPRKAELVGSLLVALSLCLLIMVLGSRLERDEPLSIKTDSDCTVTISNRKINTGVACIIYIDERVLGTEYGKEVRKFLMGTDFEKCVVVSKAGCLGVSETTIGRVELIILSGITIDQIEIKEGSIKYILLNPAFLPACMPSGSIQAIVYPEINHLQHLEPEASSFNKFQSKIRLFPFNENFEKSWS
jgi:hypothetical protein